MFNAEVCVGYLFGLDARILWVSGPGYRAVICCSAGDKVWLCNDVGVL